MPSVPCIYVSIQSRQEDKNEIIDQSQNDIWCED